jgi:hypothetical protein
VSRKIRNLAIRWLIAGGISLKFIGGCVAAFADGFGDPPPPISQSIRQKWVGGGMLALGTGAAVASAITLYILENRRRG